MTKTWFAANFCPRDATCSLEDGELTPSNGPKIRTLKLTERLDRPYAATVQAFTDERSFDEAGTGRNGWIKCDGQLLSIATSEALFSLLGTSYGGDGRTNFGVPDLSNYPDVNYYIYTLAFAR